ncbi:MAG: BrnA antitoxin family protein [Nitrospirae bacterium]|nr:BrnA antitoxin family protein [Nitrospirota bacterium]
MKKLKPENISQQDWDAVESPPLTESFLTGMKPVHEAHPDMPPRVVRGFQKSPRKSPVSIRLDESIVAAFRATGRGWQSRVNAALNDWLKEHKPA